MPRDVDTAEHGARAKVAAAAERGGFVLLAGRGDLDEAAQILRAWGDTGDEDVAPGWPGC